MGERTLSFVDGPDNGHVGVAADRAKALTKRVEQLESNITLFIARIHHVTFNCKAEDSALWMLNWENELLGGHLSEEEDESSEQGPLERSVVPE